MSYQCRELCVSVDCQWPSYEYVSEKEKEGGRGEMILLFPLESATNAHLSLELLVLKI